jgi:RNA polymerase sigma-70 factor (ECF subfamily)
LTDPELIQALLNKQQDAFRLLVDRYKDRMYNTILSFVQNVEDAEDLVQDVFIKLFENIHQFKGDAQLATWMYKIAVTHSIDFIRKKKRKKRAGIILTWLGVGEKEILQPTEFNHPGVIAEHKELAAVLFKAIEQLVENQKTAFLLQKVEGLSVLEIAKILQCNEGAVESLLSRAKANLKKILRAYYTA